MKAKHCDECKNSVVEEALLICALGHKPRFFKPRYIHDYQWGWKRNCTDYEQIAKHRETEAGRARWQGGGDAKAKPAPMKQEVSFVPV